MSDDEISISVDVRFTMVPLWVTECELITDRALRLYVVLRQHADNSTGASWCKRKTLAAECRWSVKTLDRALRELIAAGAVTVRLRWKSAGPNPSYSFEQSATHPEQTSSLYTLRSLPPTASMRGGDKSVSPSDVGSEEGGDKSVSRGRDKSVPGVGTDLSLKLDPLDLDPDELKEGGCVSGVRHLREDAPVDNPPPLPAESVDAATEPATDEPPNPWCVDHPGGTDEVKCGRCGDRRRERKTWEAENAKARAAARRAEISERNQAEADEIAACGMCDADGFTGPAVKCLHDPHAIETARKGSAKVRAALAAKSRPRDTNPRPDRSGPATACTAPKADALTARR